MCLECTSWVIRQWANSHQVDIRQLTNSHDQVDISQLTNRYQVSRLSSTHPWIIWKKLVISHLFGALYRTKRLFTRVLMCLLCFNDNPSLDLSFTFAWQSLVTISSSAHFSSNVLCFSLLWDRNVLNYTNVWDSHLCFQLFYTFWKLSTCA